MYMTQNFKRGLNSTNASHNTTKTKVGLKNTTSVSGGQDYLDVSRQSRYPDLKIESVDAKPQDEELRLDSR